MESCPGDNIGAVKKGAVVVRRRDESVAAAERALDKSLVTGDK